MCSDVLNRYCRCTAWWPLLASLPTSPSKHALAASCLRIAMVGQWTATMKPSRSDEVLDDGVRAQFDSMAPKRPTKPNRSESDSTPTPLSEENTPIPEFQKFQSLQSQSQALFSEAKIEQLEEFVETQYYKQLDSVDKQHHTTGSGFIELSSSECGGGGDGHNLQLQNGYEMERE
ncbi:uncharacterized protein LOC130784387 isoform X2 [Actinidia eriantha]|uniref:uncharacterized protein LOC130784387 isoform X2 n=1 Tax=Actinidia eriantha TaxID=165200 RepID=UPI002582FF4C|nr:uncharacterized protein LOC130784387 isoform X2 [Actinidia eriantha]